MFNTILSTLTSKLPVNFLLGSYVPVLVFGFLNAALLAVHVAAYRDLAAAQITKPNPFFIAVLFVASLVVAYMISTIVDALRRFLEGRRVWPAALARALRQSQQSRAELIDRQLEEARGIRHAVAQETANWQLTLRNAAAAGTRLHPGETGYYGSANDPDDAQGDAARRATAVRLHALRALRSAGKNIGADALRDAVSLMRTSLTQYDAASDTDLADDYRLLLNLIDYSAKNAAAQELQQFTIRQTEFGLLTPEPTRLGNVAAALESYTVSRYGLDLNTLWSRLQPVLQKNNKDTFATIADAKTQLDFLVACCWLSGLTTILWFVMLVAVGDSPLTFLIVALGGPWLAYFFYSLAVTNYISYGELIRAAVDLNRFDLLKELRVAQPDGIRQERATWTALRQLSSFGTQGVELSYERPK